ncbi:MAG: isoprenylcysteine carboxylmethyltransferase family protein [Ignavibacteriales bacterium]|nr:isoprenylcysteine carboxylmethyltransferase family protein [Ignavibacteriales bacterium]
MDRNMFFNLVIACVTTHIVRSVYEILKHKKVVKPTKLSFVIIFADMALLWTSWFVLCGLDIYRIDLPAIIRYAGIAFSGAGGIVFAIALFTIKSLENHEGDLITNGIYSRIRHPMYLGFILWLIGFPIFYGALSSFVLSFFFIANVLLWRSLEEKELVERFSAYRAYRKTTIF